MITRFAPSLTGYLHLGHVLHMHYVWGVAQKMGAKVLCRIEDHDLGRARPEYETGILETMEWLGFVPDFGITSATAAGPSDFRQSDCGKHYEAVLRHLRDRGLVYGCDCTRKQILERQSGQGELCYPGTCADKGLPLDGNTVRLRVPAGEIVFHDLNLGEQRQTPRVQCGDFSLRDRAGQWTYQFACVCDDIRHGVDLVVRGEDILLSTARQIQLLQLLGAPLPRYFHHPLLLDDAGKKLSKRQRSESIAELRAAGATPEQVMAQALSRESAAEPGHQLF
ncbi:glutamate--tRNA ligase family protein [Pontiella sp.]|uniref:glutamate--tRNA ligase family protein n=1 Tax=Pontiella sp. TaxID=2837462 RepID=UPI0035649226